MQPLALPTAAFKKVKSYTIKYQMMKNKYFITTAVITCISTVLPFFAMAQDPGGGPDAPIDGGLSLLVAAGVGYGVKKYRDSRKKNEEVKE